VIIGKHLKKYIKIYEIDTSHFNENKNSSKKIELKDILIEGSTYNRTNLKERLYKEKLLDSDMLFMWSR
jgi:allantoicase